MTSTRDPPPPPALPHGALRFSVLLWPFKFHLLQFESFLLYLAIQFPSVSCSHTCTHKPIDILNSIRTLVPLGKGPGLSVSPVPGTVHGIQ